jgi:hypothetical protein
MLNHASILRADPPTECEFGPVRFLRTEPDAQRLDQFMPLAGPQLVVGDRLASRLILQGGLLKAQGRTGTRRATFKDH